MALTDKLTAIADAIRDKTGGTEEMTLDQMATEINGIEVGGGSGGGGSAEFFDIEINDLTASAGFYYVPNADAESFVKADAAGTYSVFNGVCYVQHSYPMISSEDWVTYSSVGGIASIMKFNGAGKVICTP